MFLLELYGHLCALSRNEVNNNIDVKQFTGCNFINMRDVYKSNRSLQ
jgi:hypothetical protein